MPKYMDEHYPDIPLKQYEFTIDKCIEYLCKNANNINVDQHFKLIKVVRERNKKLFKGNKRT